MGWKEGTWEGEEVVGGEVGAEVGTWVGRAVGKSVGEGVIMVEPSFCQQLVVGGPTAPDIFL